MPNLKRSHCFSVAGGQFNVVRLTLQWNNGGASLGVVPSLSIFPVNVESLFVSNVTHHGLFCVFSHFIIRTPPWCSDSLCLLTGSAPLCGVCMMHSDVLLFISQAFFWQLRTNHTIYRWLKVVSMDSEIFWDFEIPCRIILILSGTAP